MDQCIRLSIWSQLHPRLPVLGSIRTKWGKTGGERGIATTQLPIEVWKIFESMRYATVPPFSTFFLAHSGISRASHRVPVGPPVSHRWRPSHYHHLCRLCSSFPDLRGYQALHCTFRYLRNKATAHSLQRASKSGFAAFRRHKRPGMACQRWELLVLQSSELTVVATHQHFG